MGVKDWFRRKRLQDYLSSDDQAAILSAIRKAEGKTSGELRVHLDLRCAGDPVARAARIFDQLGMRRTKERNGVLIFCALQDRRFALYGDEGIHQRVGADFWRQLAAGVIECIHENHLAAGLCLAVETIGAQLSVHFPRQADDRNELSDEISFHSN